MTQKVSNAPKTTQKGGREHRLHNEKSIDCTATITTRTTHRTMSSAPGASNAEGGSATTGNTWTPKTIPIISKEPQPNIDYGSGTPGFIAGTATLDNHIAWSRRILAHHDMGALAALMTRFSEYYQKVDPQKNLQAPGYDYAFRTTTDDPAGLIVLDVMNVMITTQVAQGQSLEQEVRMKTSQFDSLNDELQEALLLKTLREERVKDLEKQVQQQQDLIGMLNDKTTTSSGTKKALVDNPPAFNASEEIAEKRLKQFENWHDKILLKWAQEKSTFATEHNKLLHAAGLLEGSAWKADDDEWKWKTGEDLMKELKNKYMTLDMSGTYQKELNNLKMEGKHKLWADFITRLTELFDILDYDDASRVRSLKAKVSVELDKLNRNQMKKPKDDDWVGWKDHFSILATNLENSEHMNRVDDNTSNQKKDGYETPSTDKTTTQGGNQMDTSIDGMKIARINGQEKRRRFINNLCMNCGKPNHLARDCRSHPNPGNNNAQGARGGFNNNRDGAPRGRGGSAGFPVRQDVRAASFGEYDDPNYSNEYYDDGNNVNSGNTGRVVGTVDGQGVFHAFEDNNGQGNA
ncbi:hypothetical protein B0H66DRAFT_568469 [Apodospora peruviana]|uniref:CCHC-type domain-containing protein n=1 Tax=Apodospora peruviana TaxID=516989 RepID=A0AAE0HU28_9PEZI|nr:hypothetical protein B0H66DRAFT_568469 [Apodospora peruviana]